MTIVVNNDYFGAALNRFLQQYKGAPNITSLVEIFSEQVQELENVNIDMQTSRSLSTAVGAQLDNFGKLVGQARLGFNDDFYRVLLYAKIGINNSQGDPQTVIAILKLLSNSTSVHYMNIGGGNIALTINGSIDPSLYNFVYLQMEQVVAAGIHIDYISMVSPDNDAFTFAGGNGKGFGSIYDSTLGGKFASLIPNKIYFAFDSSSTMTAGFGSIYDSSVGGQFVST